MRNPGVLFLAATFLLAAASLGLAQGWKRYAKPGPYRVVVSDPIVLRGTTVPEVSYEDPKLAEVSNRLDREGFAPVFPVVAVGDRLVIVAVER
ncbi:MAG TPA: hypothetical protein VFI25_12120 [Planctomycetota bacterium]|jgi:hypothetical protein|nr:hypothetical protein [Planctomycetota bacterium]